MDTLRMKPRIKTEHNQDGTLGIQKFVDVPKLYQELFTQQIQRSPFSCEKLKITRISDSEFTFEYPLHYCSPIESKLNSHDFPYFYDILSREPPLREDLEQKLFYFEQCLRNGNLGRIDFNGILESYINYVSLDYHNFFPDQAIPNMLNVVFEGDKDKVQSFLYRVISSPSGRNYFTDMYLGLVELAQDLSEGKTPPFDYFIDNLGYLKSDFFIRGKFENRVFLLDTVKEMVANNPYIDFKSAKSEVFWNRKFNGIERRKAVESIMKVAKRRRKNPEYVQFLLDFAAVAIEYDDNEHRYERKTKKLLRELMENLGLNVFTVGSSEIEKAIKEIKIKASTAVGA